MFTFLCGCLGFCFNFRIQNNFSREQRAEELRQAKQELEAALAELKAQEDAYNAKTEELKRKSEGGGVAALRAKSLH